MNRYTTQVRAEPAMTELRELLPQILASPELHARLVNTLSRMEYIGVRKMLKTRHSDDLDEAGLLHIIEEASHALRLKRAAFQLGGERDSVATYAEAHTLGGQAGEDYMQAVDQACEDLLSDLPLDARQRAEANYLLSSVVIEVRAEAFYPLYEECLQAAGAPFSVNSILKDELKHLAEMQASLQALFPDEWEGFVEGALEKEGACFRSWLTAIRDAVPIHGEVRRLQRAGPSGATSPGASR